MRILIVENIDHRVLTDIWNIRLISVNIFALGGHEFNFNLSNTFTTPPPYSPILVILGPSLVMFTSIACVPSKVAIPTSDQGWSDYVWSPSVFRVEIKCVCRNNTQVKSVNLPKMSSDCSFLGSG